jgi:hypothetical protein
MSVSANDRKRRSHLCSLKGRRNRDNCDTKLGNGNRVSLIAKVGTGTSERVEDQEGSSQCLVLRYVLIPSLYLCGRKDTTG